MKTVVIGDVTFGTEIFISQRGIGKYYHLPKDLVVNIFSMPVLDNLFLGNSLGVNDFCEVASHCENITSVVMDYSLIEDLPENAKENLSLYLDLFAEYCSLYVVATGEDSSDTALNFMRRKVFFLNAIDISNIRIIGLDSTYHEKEVSLFGSCVSRDTIEISNNITPYLIRLKEYIARNSIAGLLSEVMDFSEEDIDITSPFLKRCIHHDLKKTAAKSIIDSLSTESLFIMDFMDERFDLIQINGALVTNSWDFRATKLAKKITPSATPLTFYSMEKLTLWKNAFDVLYHQLIKKIPSRNVIVLLPFMASVLYDGEAFSCFDNKKYAMYQYNEMLYLMKCHLSENYPEITLVEPRPWMMFCDYRHKWGAHPYHYNNYLYLYFSRLIKGH
ncbi:DUF6270 domain-containing protein [Cronobacter dublinensis]